MMQRILFGTAVGLVAVGGASAADFPVKLTPVEYVKVCSLYGAGYWYVPGTDTCIKLGAYARAQMTWNADGSGTAIGANAGPAAFAARLDRTDTNQLAYQVRSVLTMDARTQTEYGTLRSYMAGGFQQSSPSDTAGVFWNLGFLQFAGFTAGRAVSYFDFYPGPLFGYAVPHQLAITGPVGINLFAYTMTLGSGFTATLSLEDGGASSAGTAAGGGRGHMTVNTAVPGSFGLATTTYDNAGHRFPEIVGALRVDQDWGAAQIMAVAHDASGGYYGTNLAGAAVNGHPADAWGWAVGGGATLQNVLGMRGDLLSFETRYSVGAQGYVAGALSANWALYGTGNNVGLGWATDGVYGSSGRVELTEAWGFTGGYQHLWSPQWRTSITGGYSAINYNAAATTLICGSLTAAGSPNFNTVSNCSPSFSYWQLGTRTQWNPVPDLDIGLDITYTKLNTAFAGTATLGPAGARPAGMYAVADQNVVSAVLRFQRNFIP